MWVDVAQVVDCLLVIQFSSSQSSCSSVLEQDTESEVDPDEHQAPYMTAVCKQEVKTSISFNIFLLFKPFSPSVQP